MFRFKLRRRKLRIIFLQYGMEIIRYKGSSIPYKKIRKLSEEKGLDADIIVLEDISIKVI